MSTKIRALLWEELRTGGVIAGWCVLVCMMVLSSIWLFLDDWRFTNGPAMFISMGTVLMVVLLLLYRTGNSGVLTGGFSGRILMLPVETWRAVLLILSVRGALVFTASVVLFAWCRLLFGFGPLWVFCLLYPTLYFLVQTLDWIRRPMPRLAGLGFLVLVFGIVGGYVEVTRNIDTFRGAGAIEYFFYTLEDLSSGGKNEFPVGGFAALVMLVASGVPAYGVSLVGVGRARRGAWGGRAFRLGLPEALPLPGALDMRGFRSPRGALLWWFLRKDGALLPVGVAALGLLLATAYGMATRFFEVPDRLSDLVLLWAIWPVLLLATMWWGLTRGGAGIQRGVRPSLTEYLYPIGSSEMTVTRLWGHGLVLGITWAVALVVSSAGFIRSDDGLAWRIYTEALAAGETDLREILQTRLLLPATMLLVAWALMVLRTRLAAWFFGVTVLLWSVGGVFYGAYHSDDEVWLICATILVALFLGVTGSVIRLVRQGRSKAWHAVVLAITFVLAMVPGEDYRGPAENWLWLPAALLIVMTVAVLCWAGIRGVAPRRHLAGCAVAWGAIALFTYPYGAWELSGVDRQSLLVSLSLGALAVFPYPALLIDLHRRRHLEDTPVAPSENAVVSGWNLSAPSRAVLAVVVVGFAAALVWLRWPARPVYIEALRAQGQPATPADLAEFYGPMPVEENAALHYLKVLRKYRTSGNAWGLWIDEKRQASDEETSVMVYGGENELLYGSVNVKYNESVWDKRWEVAQARFQQVDKPISDSLMAVAAKDYPRSHYPIDIGTGVQVGLPHLSALRQLARSLSMASWVAAVEDRPEDVVRYIKALGPVAESLREEPILISQLVRIAIHGIGVAAVEQALSRTSFTDEQLREMQEYLQTLLPPVEEHSMITQGLIGERVFSTQVSPDEVAADYLRSPVGVEFQSWIQSFSRTTILRCYAAMLAPQGSGEGTPLIAELESATNPEFALAQILVPALDRSREAEWRCRVTLDMAGTACAVERYRLAHGALPTTLADLVPTYIEGVPVDPFRDDGGPISYVWNEDGSYRLYTWAMNRTDEGGIHQDRTEKKGSNWSNGDWMFYVASPAFRDGPQITKVPPAEDE